MTVRIALGQVDPRLGDLDGNAARILAHVEQAGHGGADVVVFGLLALTGYPLGDLSSRSSLRRATADTLKRLARDISVAGHGNLAAVLTTPSGPDPEDAAVVLLRGGEVTPLHPDPVAWHTSSETKGGSEPALLEIAGHRLGIVAGGSLDQHRSPIQSLDAVLVCGAWAYEHDVCRTRRALIQQGARAIDRPVLWTNLVGGQDDLVFDGSSFAADARGNIMATSPMFSTDVLFVDLSASDVAPRPSNATGQSRRAPSLTPGDDVGECYEALVLSLRDYVVKNGFHRVVLGLSGGIDSSMAAAVAADAIGADNVTAVAMPSGYSSTHSLQDAEAQAHTSGFDYRIQPITGMFDAVQHELQLDGVAKENLQARLRGVILMAISNTEGHLVLAPGNKSELAVGYSTIYGDAVGGFAPLKDVLKTQVWQLARWRNAYARQRGEPEPIPARTITKPPSAELRPDQQDADSLPAYDKLDPALRAHLADHASRSEMLAAGHDAEAIDLVLQLVPRSEWKRRQYPLGPRVSSWPLHGGHELPITSAWHEP